MSTENTATQSDSPKGNLFDKPRLILTHGEKGGVGKTTVARVLADFLNSKKISFRAFDAEGPSASTATKRPPSMSRIPPVSPRFSTT